MKNKKALYILVPAVVAVWALVTINIIRGVRGIDDEYSSIGFYEKMDQLNALTDTIYPLSLNYSDPFLKNQYRPTSETNKEKSETPQVQRRSLRQRHTQQVNIIQWPEVRYEGLIANQKNKVQVGLIQINSNATLMKAGEERDGIRLIKLYTDSIVLTYKNETKTFYK